MKKAIKILGIETSCDETAAAVLKFTDKTEILSNVISSQIKTHAKFGGVVPEVAARMHVENILPVINQALKDAKIKNSELDAIAVTGGPGLMPALITGVETAKTLAYTWQKPLIRINHIEGHVYSSLLDEELKKIKKLFPSLALIVSGGHTDLIQMKDHGKYRWIGGTRDDAVGEAFDKVAKMMDLGYPGGPIVSKFADKFSGKKNIELPRPMLDKPNFEMSFSGIKTSVLYKIEKMGKLKDKEIAEMSHEFQESVTDVLVKKTLRAAEKLQVKSILLGGGVAANKALRNKLETVFNEKLPKVKIKIPEIKFTGDNAVMIALPAYFHYKNKNFIDPKKFRPDPNWELV